MMQRPARIRLEAANDNVVGARRALTRIRTRSAQDLLRMPFIPRPPGATLAHPRSSAEPVRIGFRPLAIAAMSGLVLVALCGAFLLGLAFVGVLAGVVTGFELVRRHRRRSERIVAFDRPIAG
jgi:hypothetical protein